MNVSIIQYIRESEKKNIALASMEGMDCPVIYKEISDGNCLIYEKIKNSNSDYFPKIYALEEDCGRIKVCEEYAAGQPLSVLLLSQKLSVEAVFNVAFQLCEALSLLHSQTPPIIHRDIKPDNIIIGRDYNIKIVDFDISRLFKPESGDNDTRLLGTVSYAAPEQYGYSQTDCRTDIYSLGIVLKQLMEAASPELTGRLRTKYQKMVNRCTSFDPDDRYSSVGELKKVLSGIYTGYRLLHGKKYHIMLCSALGAAAVCLILLFILLPGGAAEKNADGHGPETAAENDAAGTSEIDFAASGNRPGSDTENVIKAGAHKGTEASAENGIQAGGEDAAENGTQAGNEASAENGTEASAKNGTEASAENGTEAFAENGTEASAENGSIITEGFENSEENPKENPEENPERDSEEDPEEDRGEEDDFDPLSVDYLTESSFTVSDNVILFPTYNKNLPDAQFSLRTPDGSPISQFTIEFSVPEDAKIRMISYDDKFLYQGTGTIETEPPYPGGEKPVYKYKLTNNKNHVKVTVEQQGDYPLTDGLYLDYKRADGSIFTNYISCRYNNPYEMYSDGPSITYLTYTHEFSLWKIITVRKGYDEFCKKIADGTILVILGKDSAVPVLENGEFKGEMKTDKSSNYVTVYDTELKIPLYRGIYVIEIND